VYQIKYSSIIGVFFISVSVIILILSQIRIYMNALLRSIKFRNKGLFVLVFLITLVSCNNSPKSEEKKTKEALPVSPSSAVINNTKSNPITDSRVSMDSIQALLKGKWLRSDGTYSIDIFSVSSDGRMDAGYFNPNPIKVGNSGWELRDGVILLEVVLRDANYPGSKYNLLYDPNSDCLAGNYFQAVQGINYDVIFTRNK